MLVMLGPPFEGTDEQYACLARATGMVPYDLRTKLKPGVWGVVRALADASQASALARELRAEGLRVASIDPWVGHDPERPIVPLRGIEFGDQQMVLLLREREIPVPYGALLTIVRGEVQLAGDGPGSARSVSSSNFRAVSPNANDVAVFREQMSSGGFDAYQAADLHFVTVNWVARIDPRAFDFSMLGPSAGSLVQALDKLVDWLAERAGVRVDRSARVSSVSSFTARPAGSRNLSPAPGSPASARGRADSPFDAYSRMIAEAERQTRA